MVCGYTECRVNYKKKEAFSIRCLLLGVVGLDVLGLIVGICSAV